MRTTWESRVTECIDRIHRKAILRDDQKRIADLIRGDDSDSLRIIIACEENLPETPAGREAISMRRWSLNPHLDGVREIGWFWDNSGEGPAWTRLRAREHLRLTYALCLRPEFAQYAKRRLDTRHTWHHRKPATCTTTSPGTHAAPRRNLGPSRALRRG